MRQRRTVREGVVILSAVSLEYTAAIALVEGTPDVRVVRVMPGRHLPGLLLVTLL